jgi:hypothetical protein
MRWALVASAAVLCLVAAGWAGAEDAEAGKESEVLSRAAAEYRLALAKDPDQKLQAEDAPLLRWTNPQRDDNRGITVLWTLRGRPQAIACIYTYGDDAIDHEFQSLSAEALEARRNDKVVWRPEPGVEWKPLPDAGRPAATAGQRLLQMRSLARRFAAVVHQNQDHHELRLLPQPLYRYPAPREAADPSDGAILALVQATDPEVLLLLEVQDTKSGPAWHYALARMTDLPLEVQLDGKQVWSVEAWDWRKRAASQTYIKFTETVRR